MNELSEFMSKNSGGLELNHLFLRFQENTPGSVRREFSSSSSRTAYLCFQSSPKEENSTPVDH